MFKEDHPAVGQAFRCAGQLAREFGHARVGSEHLLLALTEGPWRGSPGSSGRFGRRPRTAPAWPPTARR